MKITAGNYHTEFSTDENMWKTYHNQNLIAATTEDLWSNDNIRFASREAGEVLLYTTIEITAGLDTFLDSKIVATEISASMEKTDEGTVKNVETPSEKIEDEEPLNEERLIMIKIEALLDEAVLSQHKGLNIKDKLAKIDLLQVEYNVIQKMALKSEMASLIRTAEFDLTSDKDCTAALNRVEEIVKALNDGRFE